MAEDEKKEEETGEKEHQAGSSWEWPQLNDTWTGDLRRSTSQSLCEWDYSPENLDKPAVWLFPPQLKRRLQSGEITAVCPQGDKSGLCGRRAGSLRYWSDGQSMKVQRQESSRWCHRQLNNNLRKCAQTRLTQNRKVTKGWRFVSLLPRVTSSLSVCRWSSAAFLLPSPHYTPSLRLTLRISALGLQYWRNCFP